MEVWKRYYIEESPTRYEVSNYGRIRNVEFVHRKNGGILKQRGKKNGYLQSCLYHNDKKYYRYNHRLVGELFLDTNNIDIDNMDINHIDGNKQNNYYKNLEWCTRKQNMEHASKTGLLDTIPCQVYDITGKFIGEFKSVTDAKNAVGLHGTASIEKKVMDNPQKQYGGYQWRTNYNVPVYDLSDTYKKDVRKPVIRYSLDGEVIETYASISDAVRALGVTNESRIRRCCNGLQDTYKNSRWAWL